ncbi:hypothetical protein F5Y15DRAFT_428247 [Xylariaceae sp. FL0016]|nr:hypothetical protein F5Y15DRAFT_428247 [Xylariaceae sp. FL0016]
MDRHTPQPNKSDTNLSSPYPAATRGQAQSQDALPDVPRTGLARVRYVFSCWWFEILATFVAVLSLTGMFVVPGLYDGRRVPEWLYGVNITSLLAVLSVVFKAALLLAVTEVLAQMKYVVFRESRPLRQLQVLDEGTRGAYGALKLLLSPVHVVVTVAGLAVVLSLAVDPLVQQSVRTVACQQVIPDANATIPVANYVPGTSGYYRVGAGEWELKFDMKGAMLNGITDPGSNDTNVKADCSTGNCTFADHGGISYSSIGLCSKCIDTTSLIESIAIVPTYPNYSLPNDMWISPTTQAPYLAVHTENYTGFSWIEAADASLFTEEMRSVAQAAIVNVTTMAFTNAPCSINSLGVVQNCPHNVTGFYGETDYVATSCSLYVCLKDFQANILQGTLNETVICTTPAYPASISGVTTGTSAASYAAGNYTTVSIPCMYNGTYRDASNYTAGIPATELSWAIVNGTNTSVPQTCRYDITVPYVNAVASYLGEILEGKCDYSSSQAGEVYCGTSWWLKVFYGEQDTTFASVAATFDDFATVVTNKFRSTGLGAHGTSSPRAVGTVHETDLCIAFEPAWLSLHALLCIVVLILVVYIVRHTFAHPEQPIWKSSLLPLLLYGFGSTQNRGESLGKVEKRAETIRARGGNGAGARDVYAQPLMPENHGLLKPTRGSCKQAKT